MIDFTNGKEIGNFYGGSEYKKAIIYDNKKYLVKLPDLVREKNTNVTYINNVFSEYVGSNIFNLVGFNTQNTILGKYNFNGKEKIVCACEDFTDFFHTLCEFGSLTLSLDFDNKIDVDLDDVLIATNILKDMFNINDIKDKFWDMFVIDAFIGNTDRHNGNWGVIYDAINDKYYLSPIYDCGSALNPLLSDEEIFKLNESEIKNLGINTYSCLKINNKRINYMSYIKSMENTDLNKAILRVFNNINIDEINKFIDSIECISEVRKNFYKNLIKIRYDILKEVYENIS